MCGAIRSLSYGFIGVVGVFMLAMSTPAAAFMDIQLIAGSRSGDWKYEGSDGERKKTFSSVETGLSLHFSPIPKIPFSFGLGIYTNNFDSTDALKAMAAEDPGIGDDGNPLIYDGLKGSISGMTYSPEIMTWIPIGRGGFKPFLRVGYAVGSYDDVWKLTMTDSGTVINGKIVTTYSVSGAQYGLGFMYSPIPTFGFFAEYNVNRLQLKGKKQKITLSGDAGSVSTETGASELEELEKKRDLNTGAARLGFNFNI